MTLPSVKDFFAQYAHGGYIFPAPGLRVRTRDGAVMFLSFIAPSYTKHMETFPIRGVKAHYWTLEGKYQNNGAKSTYDITAILDESGNVIAGEANQ